MPISIFLDQSTASALQNEEPLATHFPIEAPTGRAILKNACAFGYAVAAGLAKRMECVQLAAAFESLGCPRAPPSRFAL